MPITQVRIEPGAVPVSRILERRILRMVEWLWRFHPSIVRCTVWLSGPGPHHHLGTYSVKIDLHLSHAVLSVAGQHGADIRAALRHAFDAARRRLEDQVRRLRGFVKTHATFERGQLISLEEDGARGVLEARDGHRAIFERDSLRPRGSRALRAGVSMRWTEEDRDGVVYARTAHVVSTRRGRRSDARAA